MICRPAPTGDKIGGLLEGDAVVFSVVVKFEALLSENDWAGSRYYPIRGDVSAAAN